MNHLQLDRLNDAQREAVTAPVDQHCLVLAGAGSGKTNVLVHRMAYLMTEHHCSPYSIMAVTFTNKAAQEMRHRLSEMIDLPTQHLWMGTFHGLCHRLLRQHAEAASLPDHFQIIDSEDQLRLLRKIHKELKLDEGQWPPKKSQHFINRQKEQGRRAEAASKQHQHEPYVLGLCQVYAWYEAVCQRSGLVDFAELLCRTLELLLADDSLRSHYHSRFSHLLVDEFQDTNTIQYQWLRCLAGPQTTVMAVGDDDQSIYSWRGAQVENIFRFEQDFQKAHVIRLEQNYRSTQTILSAANAVIACNNERMGKSLWTQGDEGDPIKCYRAFNDVDEARFLKDHIQAWIDQGGAYDDIAVLYRSNAQSRLIEEQLNQAQIPYRVYGGLRFFERAEIKDALAYCRLIVNPEDDAAFERVVNTPTRGIGQTTLDHLRRYAVEQQRSLWQSSRAMLQAGALSGRAHKALESFCTLIDDLTIWAHHTHLGMIIDTVFERSDLIAFYEKDKSQRAQSKVDNLQELRSAMHGFHLPDHTLPPLVHFLSSTSLDAGQADQDEPSAQVQLMTLHAAKGLEFPVVMMTGLEEGLFPHHASAADPRRLEEERRLCYVGMTRARQSLLMSYAEHRRINGRDSMQRPSRFLKEIPSEYVHQVHMRQTQRWSYEPQTRPAYAQPAAWSEPALTETSSSGFRSGQRVMHPRFGEGIILAVDGQGHNQRLQVQFDTSMKWLMAAYAQLTTA